jgi:hypothetical protein
MVSLWGLPWNLWIHTLWWQNCRDWTPGEGLESTTSRGRWSLAVCGFVLLVQLVQLLVGFVWRLENQFQYHQDSTL